MISRDISTDEFIVPPKQPSLPGSGFKVVVCAYLPVNEGAGVERFVLLLSNALEAAGIPSEVVDVDTAGIHTGVLRRLRYYCAWKVGIAATKTACVGDIVICNNFFSWNAPRRGFVVFHGTDRGRVRGAGRDMPLMRRLMVRTVGSFLERRTAKGRVVVAVSEAAKEEIESLYNVGVHMVVPNAVNLSRFSPVADKSALRSRLGLPADKFLILFVGTTDPRKGLDWILREIKPNLSSNQELVLRVDIDPPPEGVRVMKRMSVENLADLYRSCDVLLFPTNYEGCSFGLIEALASGLPAITSSAGSGRDLLESDELKPYVVEGRDCEAYLQCITRLQNSPEEWRRVSAACRTLAEKNHDLAKFQKIYVDLVRKMARD